MSTKFSLSNFFLYPHQHALLAQPPQFTRPITDQQIKLGEQIVLECSVTGIPQPTVEFFSVVDNFKLQTGNRLSIQHDASNTHWRLVINNAVAGDLREYRAEARSSAGSATCSAIVREKMPDAEKPRIVDGLKNKKVKEGETAEMSVKVTGTNPEVDFYKDGQKVQPDGDKIKLIKDKDGTHTLKIENAKPSDVGTYSVIARNVAGSDESSGNLAVEVEENIPPEFTQPLVDLDVKEGENAQFNVAVAGKPLPQVEWQRNNQPIQIDNSHIIAKEGPNGEHSLTIKDARHEDAGRISVKAVNPAGSAESKANFGVIEDVEAPHFVEKLKDVEVKEHDTVQLECKVVAKPEAEVVWKKDGVPVHIDNNRIVVKKDADGRQTLTIKDADKESVGTFTCEAVNKAGKDATSADLKFPKYAFETKPEESVKPFFIEPLPAATQIKEGETVTLKCKVNPESKPDIQWSKNGQPIQPSQNMIIEKLDDGTLKLTILNAKKEDLGNYRVSD